MPLSALSPTQFHVSEETLKSRLLPVMVLRVVLTTVLLGATLALNYRAEDAFSAPSARFLLGLVAVTYGFSLFYSFWYRSGRALIWSARAQLSMDLLMWGGLTFATGGISSGFSALFDLWVIVWAVVLGGRAAFYCAGLSSALLLAMGALMQTGILLPLSDQLTRSLSLREFTYAAGINVSALVLVAFLVSSLVRRLERTDEGLREEQTKRADLAQLHADVIRSLTVGLATVDMDGRVLVMNPCGLETLDHSLAELEGASLSRWLPDLEKLLVPGGTLRARGHGSAFRRDKERVPVEYIVAPLTSAEGEEKGFIVVFSDLSEIRKLESALEKSRRLAALGELAASLAHEIRNPLGALSGAFQIFSSNPDLGEEDRSLLDIITREIRRLEFLVNDMLDYARPKKAETGNSDLSVLLGETVRTFLLDEDAAEREVDANIEPGIVAAVDGSQMKQLFLNLLQNAVQATEPGERIELSASMDGDFVRVDVRDFGRGIPPEHLKTIFDPFFSTRERGLGLGLALCRRIVEEHRGTIEASNGSGGGARFRITLPADGRRRNGSTRSGDALVQRR